MELLCTFSLCDSVLSLFFSVEVSLRGNRHPPHPASPRTRWVRRWWDGDRPHSYVTRDVEPGRGTHLYHPVATPRSLRGSPRTHDPRREGRRRDGSRHTGTADRRRGSRFRVVLYVPRDRYGFCLPSHPLLRHSALVLPVPSVWGSVRPPGSPDPRTVSVDSGQDKEDSGPPHPPGWSECDPDRREESTAQGKSPGSSGV